MTKIILIKDVSGLGQKDDIKEVKPGYFRNFLLPQELALEATERLIIKAKTNAKRREEEKEVEQNLLTKTLEGLKDKVLLVKKKADNTGSLFDKLDKKELISLIKEQLRFDVPEEMIKLDEPIKKTGEHEVEVGENKLKIKIEEEKEKIKKTE